MALVGTVCCGGIPGSAGNQGNRISGEGNILETVNVAGLVLDGGAAGYYRAVAGFAGIPFSSSRVDMLLVGVRCQGRRSAVAGGTPAGGADDGPLTVGPGNRCDIGRCQAPRRAVTMAVGSGAGARRRVVDRSGTVGTSRGPGRAQEDILKVAVLVDVSLVAIITGIRVSRAPCMRTVWGERFIDPNVTRGVAIGAANHILTGWLAVAAIAAHCGKGALRIAVVVASVTVHSGLAVFGHRVRQGMTGLADTGIGGVTIIFHGGRLEKGGNGEFTIINRPGQSCRVAHVPPYQPDVGLGAVGLVNVAGMAVGALDILILAIVGILALVTVGTEVYGIGGGAVQVGAKQETVTGYQASQQR